MSTDIDFKPSQVVLRAPLPLTACFDRAENELAGALMIVTLARRGDTWRAVATREIGEVIGELLKENAEPWRGMNRNPFMPKPDAFGLVERGYAVWEGEPGRAVQFTPAGLERLRRWVRP